jgi:ABC-type multidrug transport system fused ATPase/permease subunit
MAAAREGPGRDGTWWERVHLDRFAFWRPEELGGRLPGVPPEPLDLSGIWHLLGYLRFAWVGALGLLATIFASSYLGVLPAFVVKHIVNVDLAHRRLDLLGRDGADLAALYLALLLLGAANGWFGAWASNLIVYRLRGRVLDKQLTVPLQRLWARGAATTMVRTVNEVGVAGGDSPVFSGVAGVIGTITSCVSNLVTLASAVVAMFVLNGRLALVSLALLPVPIAVAIWWGKIVYGAVHRQYEKLTELTAFVLRVFEPVAIVRDRLLGRQRALESSFSARNRQLTNASIYARVLFHWYDNIFSIVQGATIGLVWLVGGHAVLGRAISLGTVLATIALINRLDGPVHNLAELWFSLRSLAAVADRVAADLEAPAEGPRPAAGRPEPTDAPGELVAEGIAIEGPDGRPFVEGVAFRARPGEPLAVLEESARDEAVWLWAAALAGQYPLAAGRLSWRGRALAPGDVAVVSAEVPVAGLTARRLWRLAGGEDVETCRALWERLAAGAPEPIPCVPPDAPLDGPERTPGERLLASAVAAALRGAPVWVVVGGPPELGLHRSAGDRVLLWVQPAGQLPEGLPWVGRRADGRLESGRSAPGWWRPSPPPTATRAWDPALLEGDGAGWWASLGLRRHRPPAGERFVAPFLHLFRYMARYWVYWVTILVLGSGAAAVTTAVSPLLTKRIIDVGIAHHLPHTVTVASMLLMLLAIVSGLFNIAFTTTFVQTGGKRMCGDIRDDFFSALLRTPLSRLRERTSAEMASRVINDVNAIFAGTDSIIKMVTWMVIPNIPSMVLLWVLGWRYGLLTLAVSAPFAALAVWAGRLNARLQRRIFSVVGALTEELHRLATPARSTVLRASGLVDEARALGERLNALLYRLGFAQSFRGGAWSAVEGFWGQAVALAFWMVGGAAIVRGHLLLGTLTALMTYAGKYVGLGGAVDGYVAIYGICSNLERVREYAEEGTERLDGEAPAPPRGAPVAVRAPAGVLPAGFALAPGAVASVRLPASARDALRDALFAWDGRAGAEVVVGGVPAAALALDRWRRCVAWLSEAYPFGEASLGELVAWAAGSDGDAAAALAVLDLGRDSPELAQTAAAWCGADRGRRLRLAAALAAAARPRIVLAETPEGAGEDGVLDQALTELRARCPEAAVLLCQVV